MNSENSTTINLTVSSSLSHQCENGNETENPVGITPTSTKSVLCPLGNGKKLEIITGQIIHDFSVYDSDEWKHETWQVKIDTQLIKVDQVTGSASLASIEGFETKCGFAIDSTDVGWLADQNKINLALYLAVEHGAINRIDFQIFAYGE